MTTRVRDFHSMLIPTATTARVVACGLPDCRHAHVIGFDNEGVPFCEIVLPANMVLTALDIVNDVQRDEQPIVCSAEVK